MQAAEVFSPIRNEATHDPKERILKLVLSGDVEAKTREATHDPKERILKPEQ